MKFALADKIYLLSFKPWQNFCDDSSTSLLVLNSKALIMHCISERHFLIINVTVSCAIKFSRAARHFVRTGAQDVDFTSVLTWFGASHLCRAMFFAPPIITEPKSRPSGSSLILRRVWGDGDQRNATSSRLAEVRKSGVCIFIFDVRAAGQMYRNRIHVLESWVCQLTAGMIIFMG